LSAHSFRKSSKCFALLAVRAFYFLHPNSLDYYYYILSYCYLLTTPLVRTDRTRDMMDQQCYLLVATYLSDGAAGISERRGRN